MFNFTKFQKKLNMRIRLSAFDGSSEYKYITSDISTEEDLSQTINFADATWDIMFLFTNVSNNPNIIDGTATFTVKEGCASGVAAAVEWLPTAWSRDNFVMLPAAAYNGNRYPCRYYKYPPMVHEQGDCGLGSPDLLTDVPRLNFIDGEPSRIQILTGDITTPCITYYDPQNGYAAILLTEQGSDRGNHGITIEENSDRNQAILRIEAPGVRRDTLYTMMDTATPSWDCGDNFYTGQSVTIRFRIEIFPASSVQDLYNRFALVRKDVTGPITLKHEIPFSAAWNILVDKYERDNWNTEGYYHVGTRDAANHSKFHDWQIGWVGGGMVTMPLIIAGQPELYRHAMQNLEWMFNQTQLPNGLFHSVRHKGIVYGDGFDTPGTDTWYMVRKQADALYFIIKQFIILQKQNAEWKLPVHWQAAAKRLADFFVAVFKKYGQLGQYFDCETGEIIVDGSSAAAMAPGALALAGEFFKNAEYIEIAESLMQQLNADVISGVTRGGPGEILKCPDSESAFAMLESFVILFEVTGKSKWLVRAEEMAAQCMTWCASYDYSFPPDSWFGRLDMRATGSVWANVQNKHSAPGICTFSGDSLFKLFRYTNNKLYLEQIQETAHNLPQYLSREDKQVGNIEYMKPGYMCERVNFSDWEGRENIGGSLFGSCWAEVSLLLTVVEIPGIYVQPDTGFLCVFDHVNAKLTKTEDGKIVLNIHNPTKFNAKIRIFAENSTDMKSILGHGAALNWPVIDIPADASSEIIL
jgi:hypothetical protein